MELKNTTAVLARSFGSTQGRLVRVEVLVLFSFLSWMLLELFGSFRRRYNNGFFRILVWTVYTLSTVLAPYTIGLLQAAGPFRDQTFALWGTTLLLIQVNSNSLSVYSIQDIEQWKRMLVQQVLQIFLVLWLIINGSGGNKSYSATIWIFWTSSIILSVRKFATLTKASKKGGLVQHSKVIADYMMVEHQQRQEKIDPTTMEGYKYIFDGEEELKASEPLTAPKYRIGLKEVTGNKSIITIDSVWRWIKDSIKDEHIAKSYKDTALSFTLFKLLKLRFCGYRLSEAGHDKTLHLVLHGLLSEEGRYVWAFGVIEEELAFMYDFFYTRLESGDLYWGLSTPILSAAIVWNFISGAFSKHYHHSIMEQRVNGTDVIRWITVVMLASLVFVHIALLIYILPDRMTVVNNLSRWIKQKREQQQANRVPAIPNKVDSWGKKLGQYSLLLNFQYHPRNALSIVTLGLIEGKREGQKAGKKIKLTEKVIIGVLSQFKENNCKIGNGESTLARYRLGSQFSWACTLPTHVHSILVWHIATTIFWNEVSPEEVPSGDGDHQVAQNLSDYCAYLVAFVPDMLPGHGYDTRRIFDSVVKESRGLFDKSKTVSDICKELMKDSQNVDGTILNTGGKLARQLRDEVTNEALRWEVLAAFWGEFILFLAPSDNTDIHAEMLAAGGEFMTHLWALLTHAGILERPSSSSGRV